MGSKVINRISAFCRAAQQRVPPILDPRHKRKKPKKGVQKKVGVWSDCLTIPPQNAKHGVCPL